MIVNINQKCIVQETAAGKAMFDGNFERSGLDPAVYREMYTQPDGRLKIEIWRMMEIYGGGGGLGIRLGGIEMTIEIEMPDEK